MIKRIHIIPLKKVYWGRRTNRADRAIKLISKYVARHYKDAEKIIIHNSVNEYIWSRSREKPPRRIVVEIRYNKNRKEAKVLLVRDSKAKALLKK